MINDQKRKFYITSVDIVHTIGIIVFGGDFMKRINISLEDNVLARTDAFTKKSGLNRSALITVALMTYIEAQEQMPTVQAQLDELKMALEKLTIK